ncbi:VOC family protein [Micromonospora sp. C51]|uniref:VOC family protein n=1 Tax=Micromonospora sp. C51 TaxID=2824879 RepID=UPI0027DC3931|nr:VOC family protein [Micromonospora sp. C51]
MVITRLPEGGNSRPTAPPLPVVPVPAPPDIRRGVAAVSPSEKSTSTVRQLRLVVQADDYDAAVRFYRDVLGLPEQAAFSGADDAQVVILDAGRATLEIANSAQKRMIDDVEVGRQVAPRIRVAFEVDDTAATTDRLVAAGAEQVAPPTTTPWQSVNARLDAPAGLHITVFQELRTLDERAALDGFGTDAAGAPPTGDDAGR